MSNQIFSITIESENGQAKTEIHAMANADFIITHLAKALSRNEQLKPLFLASLALSEDLEELTNDLEKSEAIAAKLINMINNG